MKTIRFYSKLAFLLMLLATEAIYGQTFEKEKTVNRSFRLSAETEIEVSNKYGDIHIVPWEKDSVRFEIKLKVITNKESKLDKTFDYIDFDFKSTKYYVIAQTVFVGKGTFWTEISDVASNLFSAGTRTSIDYTIYLPAKSTLKVDNKYGNIYTTDLSGKLNIILSNGDMKAHRFTGLTNLDSEYGNIDIDFVANGTITANYGELHLEDAGNISVTSRSAEIYIDNARLLDIESKRDKLFLKNVDTLTGEFYFSTLSLDELTRKIDLSTRYGKIEIEKISKNVNLFTLNTDDTDVKLNFQEDSKYALNMTVDEKTQVYYSANITDIKTADLNGDDKLINVKSTIGKGKQTPIKLSLNVKAGTVSLKLK